MGVTVAALEAAFVCVQWLQHFEEYLRLLRLIDLYTTCFQATLSVPARASAFSVGLQFHASP